MRLDKIGEFGLIDMIKKNTKVDRSVFKGIGDDCAVVSFDAKNFLLLTQDMLVEGVDFKSKENPYLIGRKALAVSLSDIAACAGIPRYAMVSLGVPADKCRHFFKDLHRGINDLAKEYKVNIVGGDLSVSKKIVLDVSVVGVIEKKSLALRSGARNGDMIFITGCLGGSISGKHLRFIPRIKEARYLAKNFKIHSMIDISDGFLQDLGHMLKESNVGAVVYGERIPQGRFSRNLTSALSDGEDFELLFALSPEAGKKLLLERDAIYSWVGMITKKEMGLKVLDQYGAPLKILRQGYTHFNAHIKP